MKNEKHDITRERRKGRILIVDDDQDFVLSLVDILEPRGYQVEIAHSVQSGREKVATFDAQVALLDIRLGRESGIDLIAQLKKARPGILCVMMTAYAAVDTAIEAIHQGAYDYLQKPLDTRYLLATLERCFERLRLESEKAAAEEALRARNVELVSMIEAVQESRQNFQTLFDTLDDFLFILDSDGNILHVNPVVEERLGYSAQELAGMNVLPAHPTERREEAVKILADLVAGKTDTCPIPLVARDGALIPVETKITRGQWGGRNVLFGISRDISERKRAEEMLRVQRDMAFALSSISGLTEASNRLLEAIFQIEGIDSGGVYLVDSLTGEVKLVTHKGLPPQFVERASHYDTDSPHAHLVMAGKPIYQRSVEFPPAIRDNIQREGLRALAVIPVQYDGQVIACLNLASHTHDEISADVRNMLAAIAAQIGGIIARVRTEESLRQRNRELALLNQMSRALTVTLDLDKVLVTVLEEVRHLLDVTACSVWLIEPGTDELVCQQATGPQSDLVRGWRLALGEGIAGWVAHSGESLIIPDTRVDKRHFGGVDQQTGLEMRSILSVPLQVKQDVIGALQVLDTEVDRFKSTDMTLVGSLTAAAAIAIDNARLVEALRKYTIELEARNEELDAFAHTVAHGLKNPLTLITGYAEILEADYTTLVIEELQRYVRAISQNVRKMGNIIDELLLLAGVRKMEVAMRPLDMGSITAKAMQWLAGTIEEQQAEISLPETWPEALGYAPWVEEVWINYLSNALKYGGRPPRLELGASPSSVTPASEGKVQGDTVRFWIRDNGPGLTPEEQDRLFTPFTRFNQTRAKGHGLGLSIVRRIVEKMGGQVGVESEEEQGSLFWFTLPAK